MERCVGCGGEFDPLLEVCFGCGFRSRNRPPVLAQSVGGTVPPEFATANDQRVRSSLLRTGYAILVLAGTVGVLLTLLRTFG